MTLSLPDGQPGDLGNLSELLKMDVKLIHGILMRFFLRSVREKTFYVTNVRPSPV